MGRVDVLPRMLQHGDAQARVMLLAGWALVGVATWLVIVRHPRWAGAAAAGSGLLLVAGSLRAGRTSDRLLWFLDSVSDRAFDGALLPAVALSMRARGRALGYEVRDSLLLRSCRYAALAAGLLVSGGLLAALVAVLVLVTWTSIDDARQVASQEP